MTKTPTVLYIYRDIQRICVDNSHSPYGPLQQPLLESFESISYVQAPS